MRLVQILFFIILLGCNNGSGPENAVNEETKPATEKATPQPSEAPNMDPIMGKGPAEIKINVAGANAPKSYLIGFIADGHFRVDSSDITNGVIEFKRADSYPQGLYYASLADNQFIQIILGDDQKFTMSCNANDLIGTMQVKGSDENEVFYKNLKFEANYNPRYRDANAKLKSITDKSSQEYKIAEKEKRELENERTAVLEEIFKKHKDLLFVQFKKAGQNPKIRTEGSDEERVYYYRKEFWDNVDWSDKRLIRTPVIINKLKRYFKELTPQNPDSLFQSAKMLVDEILPYPEYYKFITNWVAIQYEPTKTSLMDPEAVFVNMIQNYFTRERAFWADSMEVYGLQQRAGEMAQSLVGKKGPDVISTDQFGKTKSIYEMTADYIVVYLYNPTCEHCMKETPLLVDWYNKNKANNKADVFAIAIDTNEDEWKAYIKKNNMNFTNVFDPTNRSIYAKYYVDITPEVYVLNKDRTIIGKNLKVFQIDTIIERDK